MNAQIDEKRREKLALPAGPTTKQPPRTTLAAGLLLTLLLAAVAAKPALAATPCDWEPVYGPSLGAGDDTIATVNFGFNFPFQGNTYSSGFVVSVRRTPS